MSARATWKGFLKISLVTIPIKVYPATETSESLSFHQIHAECKTRIQQRKWCTTCGREVTSAELVKGFEFDTGRYVLLDDTDFAKVKPASTRVVDLVQFADAASLDPMYVDRAYYLAPDGAPAAAAYAVMRDGMSGLVGIGKLALYGREYLVAVRPQGPSLRLYTLHHAADIRDVTAIEDLAGVPARAPLAEYKLARQVMTAIKGPLDLLDFTDEYRAQLQRIIDAKIAGKEIVVPTVDMPAVADFREALQLSLVAVNLAKKTPAKAKSLPHRKRA